MNALIAYGMIPQRQEPQIGPGAQQAQSYCSSGFAGITYHPARQSTSATAVLIQPNLDVGGDNDWVGPGEWEQHIADSSRTSPASNARPTSQEFRKPVRRTAKSFARPILPTPISSSGQNRRRRLPNPIRAFGIHLPGVAKLVDAPLVVGNIGEDYNNDGQETGPTTTRPS